METKAAIASMALVGGLAAAAFKLTPSLGAAPVVQDTKAPAFSATTAEGKKVTLAELAKDRPVYLYFIKSDCPINARALPYYKQIAASYKQAPFVGVINSDADGFKQWQASNKVPFTVVLDPEKKIINSYQALASPWVIEVKKGGQIGKIWKGFSVGYLTELNENVASAAGLKAERLDFSDAPKSVRYG